MRDHVERGVAEFVPVKMDLAYVIYIHVQDSCKFHDSLPAYRFANPHWGFSLSRRWRLFGCPSLGVFFGLGASYKTETDYFDSTHWNFVEQLAIRWRIRSGVRNTCRREPHPRPLATFTRLAKNPQKRPCRKAAISPCPEPTDQLWQ
jgi:hypothetical protein